MLVLLEVIRITQFMTSSNKAISTASLGRIALLASQTELLANINLRIRVKNMLMFSPN